MLQENGLSEIVPVVSSAIKTALDNLEETPPNVPITVEWQNIISGTASFEVVVGFPLPRILHFITHHK